MNGQLPTVAGRIFLRTLRQERRPQYYAYVPPRCDARMPLLVAMHGISRNAREQALVFARTADALHCSLIAPLMSETVAQGYQRLGWGKGEVRADRLLDDCVADFAALTRQHCGKLLLWGFSGGAQFAHRYALHHPERVAALMLGAAGWYTWPDEKRRFPYGLGGRHLAADQGLHLAGFLAVPTLVLVGSRDVTRDDTTRTSRRLDRQQGQNRLERAQRWVAALHEAARQQGVAPGAQLEILPGIAHDFQAFADVGVANLVARWCSEQTNRAPAIMDRSPGDTIHA